LLALEEPWRVLKRGSQNILEPREMWELTGQVPNVVFPSGVCVDAVDEEGYASPTSKVRVYYGAADTVIGAAECTIEQLLEWCDE
jgi:beta-1,4-mannooligosaccharide/beta-1,4-mannosyl-N-acetylglucosamine phosphorylase